MIAAKVGNEKLVRSLLERGAKVNSINSVGGTALMRAVLYDHSGIATILLQNGADPMAFNSYGSPLTFAVARSNLGLVKLFLQKKADVNQQFLTGDSAVFVAASQKNLEVAKLVFESGAEINARNGVEETPLLRAVFLSNLGVVQMLVEKGADIEARNNVEKETPLIVAAKYDKADVARFLLEKKANMYATSQNGFTALSIAAWFGHNDILIELLKRGFDINHASAKEALSLTIPKQLKCFSTLLENGVDVNGDDANGWTPLMHAVDYNNVDLVKTLINHGANVNAKNNYGDTILIMAVYRKMPNMVRLLLANGADPAITNTARQTPIEIAERIQNQEILELIKAQHGPEKKALKSSK